MTGPLVAWLTGLSGAGKSTIAALVVEALSARGLRVQVLDGDDVRQRFHRQLGFSPADIRENNRLIVQLCREVPAGTDVVLVPVIAPFADARAAARHELGATFHEVYVRASLEAVQQRDPKGLYARAARGELRGMIGVAPDVPYEAPETPDLVLDTEHETAAQSAQRLVEYIERRRS